MAIRVGLAAACGCTQEQFRRALGNDELEIQETEQWFWTTFSLWAAAMGHLDTRAIKKSLAKLRVPTVYITTEDDERWYLTVTAPGKKTVESCRETSDALQKTKPKAFRDDCKRLAADLVKLGLPAEENELIGILTGDGIKRQEWDEATGNLRCFLTSIGLTGVFQDPAEEDWEEEATDEQTLDHGTAIWDQVKTLPLSKIRRGPWKISVDLISRLWLLGWFCNTDTSVGFLLTPPSGEKLDFTPPKNSMLTVSEHRGTLRLGLPWTPLGMQSKAIRQVVEVFKKLPGGTELELMTAFVAESEEEAADDERVVSGRNQRYRGVLKGKTWEVTQSHPPVDVETFQSVMDLCNTIDDRKAFQARDASEANALVALAKRSGWFCDDLPVAKGDKVHPGKASRAHLAMMFFRRRYGKMWDVQGAQARDETDEVDWQEQLVEIAKVVNAAVGTSHSGELIYQGSKSAFYRAKMLQLEDKLSGLAGILENLFGDGADEMPTSQESLEERIKKTDNEMKKNGFIPFGDMVMSIGTDLILRGYGLEKSDTYGVLMAGTMGQWEYEFYTRFSNGASLTTSTTEGLKTDRLRKVFRSSHPDLSVTSLLKRHRQDVKKMTTSKAQPLVTTPSLPALAEAIDEFLVRSLG